MTAQLFIDRGANFDETRQYRYQLWRHVGSGSGPRHLWIMLNPSIANEDRDDQTMRIVMGFSERWGAGKLVVVNLFARVSKYPFDLLEPGDPVGPVNDVAITRELASADKVFFAHGTHAATHLRIMIDTRAAAVRAMAAEAIRRRGELVHNTWCLGKTKSGYPRHPLRIRADTNPVPYPVP